MSDLTAFTWLLLLPLIATPFVYLVGRLDVRRGSVLARWLALMVLVAMWIPFGFAAADLDL